MPIVHSGAAQMIIAGPETWAPGYPFNPGAWLLHNTSLTDAVYLDTGQNVQSVPGSANYVIPPGATITVSGSLTYWARTADGVTADLHIVPTATYGAPGNPAPTPAGLGISAG